MSRYPANETEGQPSKSGCQSVLTDLPDVVAFELVPRWSLKTELPMSLSDASIRKTKPRVKPFKLTDGGGLVPAGAASGSKWWRYKYRFAGKEKLLAIGAYPDVSLKRRAGASLRSTQLLQPVKTLLSEAGNQTGYSDQSQNSFKPSRANGIKSD